MTQEQTKNRQVAQLGKKWKGIRWNKEILCLVNYRY